MSLFNKHLKFLEESNYTLNFCDLYRYHNDVWITRHHEDYIPITEMTHGHLRNTINFLENQGPLSAYGLGPLWLPKLIQELERRNKER